MTQEATSEEVSPEENGENVQSDFRTVDDAVFWAVFKKIKTAHAQILERLAEL